MSDPTDDDFAPAVITGLRVEEVDKGVSYEDGVSIVLAGATVNILLLFGLDLASSFKSYRSNKSCLIHVI